jgi:hypothetical protein
MISLPHLLAPQAHRVLLRREGVVRHQLKHLAEKDQMFRV